MAEAATTIPGWLRLATAITLVSHRVGISAEVACGKIIEAIHDGLVRFELHCIGRYHEISGVSAAYCHPFTLKSLFKLNADGSVDLLGINPRLDILPPYITNNRRIEPEDPEIAAVVSAADIDALCGRLLAPPPAGDLPPVERLQAAPAVVPTSPERRTTLRQKPSKAFQSLPNKPGWAVQDILDRIHRKCAETTITQSDVAQWKPFNLQTWLGLDDSKRTSCRNAIRYLRAKLRIADNA
jgi:hypothetical protein